MARGPCCAVELELGREGGRRERSSLSADGSSPARAFDGGFDAAFDGYGEFAQKPETSSVPFRPKERAGLSVVEGRGRKASGGGVVLPFVVVCAKIDGVFDGWIEGLCGPGHARDRGSYLISPTSRPLVTLLLRTPSRKTK